MRQRPDQQVRLPPRPTTLGRSGSSSQSNCVSSLSGCSMIAMSRTLAARHAWHARRSLSSRIAAVSDWYDPQYLNARTSSNSTDAHR
jgi:hypothetical protein